MGLGDVVKDINKKHGKEKAKFGVSLSSSIPVISSTGSFALDGILGCGGIPKSRIMEYYGPACVSEDTFLSYEVWSKDGKVRRNHKGGTIKRLYERFYNVKDSSFTYGTHLQNNDSKFYVKSVDNENYVIKNEIKDVIKSGEKECYLVVTSCGYSLISTLDHKFLTPDGYVSLSDLNEGNVVYIHNNNRKKLNENITKVKPLNRPEKFVKYHPKLPKKIVNNCLYYRGKLSRFYYESYLNNMDFNDYIKLLNTESKAIIDMLKFIPDGLHVHHIDENFLNNAKENLELITPKKHGELHIKDRKMMFSVIPDTISKIEYIGKKETYDIKCNYPYNNFIANGIVVHNSGGKTTLSLLSAIEVQKVGGIAAIVDLEGTFDRKWFENLGGNSEKLVVLNPDTGAEALDMVEMLVKSGEVHFIIVDSVSAMATEAELNGDYGDAHIGQLARLMSQGMKKLNNFIVKSDASVVFINQVRQGIGMFKPPEVTSGGNALGFYSSIRLAVRRKETIGNKEDPEGFITSINVKKNKCGRPFRQVMTNLYIGKDGKFGIDKDEEIVDIALSQGIIQRCKKDKDEAGKDKKDKDGNFLYVVDEKGKSYKYGDIIIAGKKKFVAHMLSDNKLFCEIQKDVEDTLIEKNKPEDGSYNAMVEKEIVEQEEKEIKREKR